MAGNLCVHAKLLGVLNIGGPLLLVLLPPHLL
jgi:hypothetical protein